MMTIDEAVKILRQHNEWRRNDGCDARLQDPIKIGMAIDVVCGYIERERETNAAKVTK
jgi:hypothetical protein